jgi:glycosyltransferase involved in cell wall biosynthesis
MLEAMAAGVPVVTTLTPDFARDGENCLCTGVGNADRLVECVLRVLQGQELSDSLVAAGRATAEEYSLDHMGKAMEAVLRACVRAREVVTLARAAAAQQILAACQQAVSACTR